MAEHRGAISDGDAAPYAEAPLQKSVNTAPLCAPSTTAVPSIETLLPNAAGATAATNATANYASTGNERTCDTLGTTTCSTDVHTAAATADAVAAAATAVAATATTTPLVAPSLPPLPAEASPNLSLSQVRNILLLNGWALSGRAQGRCLGQVRFCRLERVMLISAPSFCPVG
eukprot:2189631-Pleurochrysis_carterae.AAC.1